MRGPDRTIVISLAHDEYARLVIQMDDPEEACDRTVGAFCIRPPAWR